MISLKKRSDHVFLTVSAPLATSVANTVVKRSVQLFSRLDALTGHRSALVATMGIGLGFGLSVVLFYQPTATQANLPVVSQAAVQAPTAMLVKLPKYETTEKVTQDQPLLQLGEGLVTHVQFAGGSDMATYLGRASLGDAVEVTGSNNGLYRFAVVEIKYIDAERINTVLQQDATSLVLSAPLDFFKSKLLVLVARPQ